LKFIIEIVCTCTFQTVVYHHSDIVNYLNYSQDQIQNLWLWILCFTTWAMQFTKKSSKIHKIFCNNYSIQKQHVFHNVFIQCPWNTICARQSSRGTGMLTKRTWNVWSILSQITSS